MCFKLKTTPLEIHLLIVKVCQFLACVPGGIFERLMKIKEVKRKRGAEPGIKILVSLF